MNTGKTLSRWIVALPLAIVVGCGQSENPPERPALDCEAPQQACGTACVDVGKDPAHCGGCDEACEGGQLCEAGACVERCSAALTDCGGACVDLQREGSHCGQCGQGCADDEVCDAGSCTCAPGLEACDGACVDTRSSTSHCGACALDCGQLANVEATACEEGLCKAAACKPGFADCDGAAANGCEVDLSNDKANCTACGFNCRPDQVCGAEGCACPAGLLDCGGDCVDPDSDLAHCGGCDQACLEGESIASAACEEGQCVYGCEESWKTCGEADEDVCSSNVMVNVNHCGDCGTSCLSGPNVASAHCLFGTCIPTCEDGWGRCGAAQDRCETDLEGTSAHCGFCDNDCATKPGVASANCEGGDCKVLSCVDGFRDCDEDGANGCESEAATDPDNCGACGVTCDGACENGLCVKPVEIVSLEEFTCARFSNGAVYCWGSNDSGQLGDGSTQDAYRPVRVSGVTNASSVHVGGHHACAILDDGAVVCWGNNEYGRFGNGSDTSSLTPVPVPQLQGIKKLSPGGGHGCGIFADDELKCWGDNDLGNLGTGNTTRSFVPVAVKNTPKAKAVVSGQGHSCALLATGGVRCWGLSWWGQIGDGKVPGGFTNPDPVDVAGLSGVLRLAQGWNHNCAITAGKTSCWGFNERGGLGDGSTSNRGAPVDLSALQQPFTSLELGWYHSCALLESGQVSCWGGNTKGQLGDGKSDDRTTPAVVPQLEGVAMVATGFEHTCALTRDGEVWCWGSNKYGELGQPDSVSQSLTPVRLVW